MMRILDCRELFVDILVPEVDYDEIYPGREAEVRLFGRGDVFRGRVQAVKGSSAVVEKDSLAANEPETEERNARIRVTLARRHSTPILRISVRLAGRAGPFLQA